MTAAARDFEDDPIDASAAENSDAGGALTPAKTGAEKSTAARTAASRTTAVKKAASASSASKAGATKRAAAATATKTAAVKKAASATEGSKAAAKTAAVKKAAAKTAAVKKAAVKTAAVKNASSKTKKKPSAVKPVAAQTSAQRSTSEVAEVPEPKPTQSGSAEAEATPRLDAEHTPEVDVEQASGPDAGQLTEPDVEQVSGPDGQQTEPDVELPSEPHGQQAESDAVQIAETPGELTPAPDAEQDQASAAEPESDAEGIPEQAESALDRVGTLEELDAPASDVDAPASDADAPASDADAPVAISIRGLVKKFGDARAVDDVDLTVPAGSFYGLVGPNGAGKTTTLSIISGLLRPDEGSVHINGIDQRADPLAAKRMMGVLPDRLRTFDRLTGRQLLYYYGQLRGLDRAVIEKRTADLARAFDLSEALSRVVSDYSAGMTKKLMLAGALIHSPRVLVLDEPFEAVDPVSSGVILDILRSYVAHGGTVILSSHGMDLIERVCSRVAVIVDGEVLAEGTIDEVRAGQTLTARFVELSGAAGEVEGLEWLHTFSD